MRQRNTIRGRGGRSAFTLIELLVATAIMVVLVGIVIQITNQVLQAWNRSSGKLAAIQEASIAMDLITQDLETAVFRNNELQWLRAEDEALQGAVSGYDAQTVALKLFSPALDQPDENEAGEPIPNSVCGISYRLDYLDPVTGERTGPDQIFALYRNVINAETTFNDLLGPVPDGESANQTTLTSNVASVWGENETIGTAEGGGLDASNYLAGNVVHFEIDFYTEGEYDADEDGVVDPINQLVNGDIFYGGDDATIGPQVTAAPDPAVKRPLAFADVTLVVLSSEGSKILQQVEAGNAPGTPEEIIEEHSTTFSRRVNFMNRPL